MIDYLNFSIPDTSNVRDTLISTSYASVREGYISYDIDPASKLYEDIMSNIPDNFRSAFKKICVQVITSNWNGYIHKDPRDIAINYLLDPGGTDVLTCFYNDDHELLKEEKIEIHKWHWIDTKVNHCVSNIETRRAALSLSIDHPSQELKDWLGSCSVKNT